MGRSFGRNCGAGGDCSLAESAVTVTVRLDIELPFLPFGDLGIHATEVDASATQLIGRYR